MPAVTCLASVKIDINPVAVQYIVFRAIAYELFIAIVFMVFRWLAPARYNVNSAEFVNDIGADRTLIGACRFQKAIM